MLVLVTGSHRLTGAEREWAERAIEARMRQFDPTHAVFIGGDAWGVDFTAEKCARKFEWFERRIFPAQWKRFGRGAGPKRNATMMSSMLKHVRTDELPLDDCIVLAFLPKGAWTPGTRDMANRAIRAGVRVEVWVPHNSYNPAIIRELQEAQPELLDASQVMILPAY